ncbi:MAG: RNase adapter RapZ [Mobiluncus sp.]|uniref:RNase adapter RapZ n=1 Tax=Mobiluncus sp. TaxID=47293 RepID=UPI0025890947|nr:RNase adapter RapZ [Mobiluncus sp.]MCI6584918.1 RNase adapter RapZ [Mobiluncus sp.]
MDDPTPTVPAGIPELDASTPRNTASRAQLLIITGMSGAGRSQTVQSLEDLDWYVVDNLPPRMLQPLARMMTPEGDGVHRLAVVVDVRSRSFFSEFMTTLDQLQEAHIEYQVLFLDTSDSVLVRRYEQVRRPHPLQGKGRILDGIQAERELLNPIRDRANIYIDTTNYSVHDLARKIREVVADEEPDGLNITVMSFGFKYGLPLDADHVVDVRFFANPYWVTELRHLSGKDEAVAKYVLSQPGARDFAENYVNTIAPVLNGYLRELKPFVTIAVGCTGGRHRSVAICEYMAKLLREKDFSVRTAHRDLGKE